MLSLIRSDLRRFVEPSSANARADTIRTLLAFGPQALVVYRLGQWLRATDRPPTRRILALFLRPVQGLLEAFVRAAYDIRLDRTADIGPGLKIFHFGGIRLRNCSIGDHCVIHQRVRIEPAVAGGPGPHVGSHVWIGPHARIVGAVQVGDHATIAAGAVVDRDVPAGSLVVGTPARVARINYDNSSVL